MALYEKVTQNNRVTMVVRRNDDLTLSYIPTDENNIDYVAYLEWVAEGNEASEYVYVSDTTPNPDALY